MRIDVITLFPDLVRVPLGLSMMGRAQQQGALDLHVHDLRDHGLGKHRQVDDTPAGGGPGTASRVLMLDIYDEGFRFFEMGSASALAVCLFLVIAVIAYIQMRYLRESFEF